jgi:uncharacterized damage-inducible protein DinB
VSASAAADLAHLLRKGFENDPWHGPATSDLLAGVSAEQAAAWPVEGAHTIWELVLHMAAWQGEVLRRFDGGVPGLPVEGDWPTPPETSESAWREALEGLEESLHRLCDRLERASDEDLADRVGQASRPLGTGVTKREMVLGLLQHNAYHGGQIALLRKALGI